MAAQDNPLGLWLPAGLTVDNLVASMAGLVAVLVAAAVYQALRFDTSFDRRIKALGERRQSLRDQGLAARSRRGQTRRTSQGLMHGVLHQLNLLRSREAADAQLQLARAGFRSREAMVLFLFCRLCLPCLFGVAGALNIFVLKFIALPGPARMPAIAAAIIGGLFAPTLYVKNCAAKRREALLKALPDGLDLLVICVEAGLTLDAALARVARELGRSFPALADEFGLTAVELAFLPDRQQALNNLGQRTNMPTLRGVINTLQQSEKFGTPLANSLRVLGAEFRDSRMIRAEEKAARLPSLLTVPMMVFIMPVLFIVLLGPAALSAIAQFAHH
jgi:tight adherence protein C